MYKRQAVPNATGYNIYVNNKKVNELPISGTFYDLTSLDADSVNSIQATALNSRGESEKSNILDVKTTKPVSYTHLDVYKRQIPDFD